MARKKMDKLSQEVAKALAAGMSYGKWKALQKPAKIVPKTIPEDWITCEWCKRPFKPRVNQRFCDVVCQKQAYYQNHKQMFSDSNAEYRKKVAAMAVK